MHLKKILYKRANSCCELCASTIHLDVYDVPPDADGSIDQAVLLCETCLTQINHPQKVDVNHWRCLNDSMWSQVPAVKVMAWRMLTRLHAEGWPQALLDMLYLDDATLSWARRLTEDPTHETASRHKDSNGTFLTAGDSVTLIKDLPVKGANFTAKRGTAVRGISLVEDNAAQIEGKVNGQQIVILTQFVKKSN